jgi:hypothetical protein
VLDDIDRLHELVADDDKELLILFEKEARERVQARSLLFGGKHWEIS